MTARRLREPDAVIEGVIPVWRCDGGRDECGETARWVETDRYTTGVTVKVVCEEHRFKGGFVVGTHISGNCRRLPTRVES